ncbi:MULTISPECIES: RidA family protein [unclassified Amycolatopsis]|uniref:RidA family protein n=1 Tax=unclassified Amycolatopsis TaxID=2618356 RepID=UPI001C695CC2|nr:Rid family hydrolase [Amycolatopsis sp. DSM 110486]QYN19283.1 RidA family protein [Amycolatopsis sp. DSM 110486]
MTVDHLNPETLSPPVMDLYSQVTVGPPGARLVAIAGQVALDRDEVLVGPGDHAAQVFLNLRAALAAAGCTPAGLVKYTIHVVDSSPALIEPIFAAAQRVFGDEFPKVASTWLGVSSLGLSDWLIEVDALAVTTTPA